MSRFYITTPIYYINAEPHLGHAYTSMVADVLARAHRLLGDEVFFLTGTDEHGQKVERAAQKAGLPIKTFADRTAQKFRDILPALNVSNDGLVSVGFVKLQTMETCGRSLFPFWMYCGLKEVIQAPLRFPFRGKKSA